MDKSIEFRPLGRHKAVGKKRKQIARFVSLVQVDHSTKWDKSIGFLGTLCIHKLKSALDFLENADG
jgi:hypothetical protein